MMYVDTKNMKLGDKYYFVNKHFHYEKIKAPTITLETIYRIVGSDYSTKEPDDRYEVIRGCAIELFGEARDKAIAELESYRDYLNKQIDKCIEEVREYTDDN